MADIKVIITDLRANTIDITEEILTNIMEETTTHTIEGGLTTI
jgi:hypothetical protein